MTRVRNIKPRCAEGQISPRQADEREAFDVTEASRRRRSWTRRRMVPGVVSGACGRDAAPVCTERDNRERGQYSAVLTDNQHKPISDGYAKREPGRGGSLQSLGILPLGDRGGRRRDNRINRQSPPPVDVTRQPVAGDVNRGGCHTPAFRRRVCFEELLYELEHRAR